MVEIKQAASGLLLGAESTRFCLQTHTQHSESCGSLGGRLTAVYGRYAVCLEKESGEVETICSSLTCLNLN